MLEPILIRARHRVLSRSHFLLVVAASGLLVAIAGCGKAPTRSDILARVGSHEITIQDLEREAQWYQKGRRPVPEKEALLEQMISRELKLQRALASGIEKDPEIRRKYEAMLAARVEELELKPRLDQVSVSSGELQAAYEQDKSHYSRPAKMRLAMVCARVDGKATPDQVSAAEQRIGEAHKVALSLPAGSKGLGRAAADYSDDQASRYRGGDIGWFNAGQVESRWPAEIVSAGLSLPNEGAISDIIKTTNGFYFVMRTDSRAPAVTPFEQVQNLIQRRLLAEKRQQIEAAFDHEVHSFARVETFSQALGKVSYPTVALPKKEELRPPTLQGITLSSNGEHPASSSSRW